MVAIEFRGVSVERDQKVLLDDITFSAEEGALVAILGPNGGGKTTLLQTAAGLLRPNTGTVRIFGHEPGAIRPSDVGIVPQSKRIDRQFPALVEELVATGIYPRWPWRLSTSNRATVRRALAQVAMEHLARQPVGTLSGGELQRVYLARCLIREPRILLLDEPAAGLDLAGEAAMYHLLSDYQRQHAATVLMVTHDWEGARLHASDLLLLNQRIRAFGPPAETASTDALLSLFGLSGHAAISHSKDCDA